MSRSWSGPRYLARQPRTDIRSGFGRHQEDSGALPAEFGNGCTRDARARGVDHVWASGLPGVSCFGREAREARTAPDVGFKRPPGGPPPPRGPPSPHQRRVNAPQANVARPVESPTAIEAFRPITVKKREEAPKVFVPPAPRGRLTVDDPPSWRNGPKGPAWELLLTSLDRRPPEQVRLQHSSRCNARTPRAITARGTGILLRRRWASKHSESSRTLSRCRSRTVALVDPRNSGAHRSRPPAPG